MRTHPGLRPLAKGIIHDIKEYVPMPIVGNGDRGTPERLFTVTEAAEVLRTSERFPRRLIAERRIRFVRIGRHVRIPESALREFIAAGLVEPVISIRRRERAA